MLSDYFGPKRMYMTWSTAGTLEYGPDLVLGISDLVRFTPIWFDLVRFGNYSDLYKSSVDSLGDRRWRRLELAENSAAIYVVYWYTYIHIIAAEIRSYQFSGENVACAFVRMRFEQT